MAQKIQPDRPEGETEPEVVEEDGVVDVNETAEVQPYQYSITSFGADFPVDGLVGSRPSGAVKVERRSLPR